MPDSGKPPPHSSNPVRSAPLRTAADERADRLAAALRANLKRRKAADRARRDMATSDAEPAPDGSPPEASSPPHDGAQEVKQR